MNIAEWEDGEVYDIGDRAFVTIKIQSKGYIFCIPAIFRSLKKHTATYHNMPTRDGSRGLWEPAGTGPQGKD